MVRQETSIDISGAWVLGHNQQQGGSELQAGARAQLIPSPITHALSSFGGRVAARTWNMLFVGRLIGMLNYIAFRPYAMKEVIRQALAAVDDPHPLVVDPLAGFSPLFIWLAQEMPHVEFLEFDQPAVIRDKRERLKTFSLPTNYHTEEADLTQTTLHEALAGRRPHIIIALGSYVSADAYSSLLLYLRPLLAEQGMVIGAFPYEPGIENLKANSALFTRLAGEPAGLVHDEQALRQIFERSGWQIQAVHRLSQLALELKKPLPADVEIITTASPA